LTSREPAPADILFVFAGASWRKRAGLDAWRAGAPAMRGDLDGLVELLLERVASASGEKRSGHATELAFSWSKVSSVHTDDGDDLGCGHLIATQPFDELGELLARSRKAPKKVLEPGADLALAGWRYVVNLVVDESGIPEGMAPVVLAVVDPSRPLVGDNAFAIHLGEPDDTGRVVVTVSALLPAAGIAEDQLGAAMARLREALIDRLELVMPFLGEHVVLVHSPHEALPPIVPGGRGSHEAPRALPVPMRRLWRGSVEHGAGVAALPYSTGVKNLLVASRQVFPQLGLEGAFTAGWSAAKIACHLAGKKHDYLKDQIVSSA
jgi:hypothetical protein